MSIVRDCQILLNKAIVHINDTNYGLSVKSIQGGLSELSDIESDYDEMEQERDNLQSTVEEYEREPVELGPFNESHFEAMNDMRKAELLAENWGKFTLEDVEKMLNC